MRGLHLTRIAGIDLTVDWSLLIIFVLITTSLASELFPQWHPARFLATLDPGRTLLLWLGQINIVLAVFNLVPDVPISRLMLTELETVWPPG